MADKGNGTVAGAMLLIAGGLIGAGAALLYAPQSGQKTRKQISRYARRVREDVEENLRDAAESVTDMIDDLGDRTAELVERGGEMAEEWRKHLQDSLERGQKNLEKQRRKLSELRS